MNIQKPFTILLVDDDPDIGTMLKMMLEFKGYAITLLNRAGNMQQMLHNNSFDLLILDMLIAGIKGTDVCSSIKSNSLYEHLPVLMISAMPDARQTCLDAGANEFISKPFEMKEILFKIKMLITVEHCKE